MDINKMKQELNSNFSCFENDEKISARKMLLKSPILRKALILFDLILKHEKQEEVVLTTVQLAKLLSVDRYSLYNTLTKMECYRIVKITDKKPKKIIFRMQHAADQGFNPLNEELVKKAIIMEE